MSTYVFTLTSDYYSRHNKLFNKLFFLGMSSSCGRTYCKLFKLDITALFLLNKTSGTIGFFKNAIMNVEHQIMVSYRRSNLNGRLILQFHCRNQHSGIF